MLSERPLWCKSDCGLWRSVIDGQKRGHVACGTFEHSGTPGGLQEHVDLLFGSIFSIAESAGTLERGFVERFRSISKGGSGRRRDAGRENTLSAKIRAASCPSRCRPPARPHPSRQGIIGHTNCGIISSDIFNTRSFHKILSQAVNFCQAA